MTPDAAKQSMARALATGDAVTIQRGMAPGAVVRSTKTVQVRFLSYDSADLVGSTKEGDRRAIVSADDVAACGLPLPLKTHDRLDFGGGRFCLIQSIDDTTRRIGGQLIGYELGVSGP